MAQTSSGRLAGREVGRTEVRAWEPRHGLLWVHLDRHADSCREYLTERSGIDAITQDELTNRLSDQMNRNMYLLTIVASVMLPPGFFTGLPGINVDGIPGSENTPWAFAAVCAALVAVVASEIWLLRRKRWV